jgi:hypothetical protein
VSYNSGDPEEKIMKEDLCLHCGGSNIQKLVEVRTSENHSLGPRAKGPFGFLSGGSFLFCDICKDCGTLTRIYVKDPDREYISGDDTRGIRWSGG